MGPTSGHRCQRELSIVQCYRDVWNLFLAARILSCIRSVALIQLISKLWSLSLTMKKSACDVYIDMKELRKNRPVFFTLSTSFLPRSFSATGGTYHFEPLIWKNSHICIATCSVMWPTVDITTFGDIKFADGALLCRYGLASVRPTEV